MRAGAREDEWWGEWDGNQRIPTVTNGNQKEDNLFLSLCDFSSQKNTFYSFDSASLCRHLRSTQIHPSDVTDSERDRIQNTHKARKRTLIIIRVKGRIFNIIAY